MSVLLLILKIIGIILLSILGLILLILLLVLFVPIRYRIFADYHDKPIGKVTVSYLLHILHITAYYNAKDDYNAKAYVFGIKVYDMQKKAAKEEAAETLTDDFTEKEMGDATEAEPKEVSKEVTEEIPMEETKASTEEISKEETKVTTEEIPIEESKVTEEELPKEEKKASTEWDDLEKEMERMEKEEYDTSIGGFLKWLRYLWHKVCKSIRNFKHTIKEFCGKIKKAYKEADFYKRLLESEVFYRAKETSLKQLKRLFKHILPRHIKGYIHFGTGDPASTGKYLGYASYLYLYWRNKMVLRPEFEEKCFDGTVKMRGHIRVVVFVDIARILYFNKNIRKIYRTVKRRIDHE